MEDYYERLGVSRDATPDELKKAYRSLARQHHPDRNPDDPAAEERFKLMSEAYSVLSDDDKRRHYDRVGHQAYSDPRGGPGGFDPSDFGNVSDILEGIFGGAFGRRRRRRGQDLTYGLEVEFVEAAKGVDKTIEIERPVDCETCAGSGAKPGTELHECNTCRGQGYVRPQMIFMSARPCPGCGGRGKRIETPCEPCQGSGATTRVEQMTVKIPPGVRHGAVRSVRGAGSRGPDGNGDLHIQIQVLEHPLFTRDGADILCEVPISFPQAVLGATIEVPTLDGRVSMKVPAGTQPGKVLRLRGKGIAAYGGAGKGDQLVMILVEVPERLTRKQRKLIEELAVEMGADSLPQQANFLEKLKKLF